MKHLSFYISLISAAFAVQVSAQTQTESNPQVIFTGTSVNVKGISNNGRYICGARMYTEAYRFDIEKKELITIPAADSYSDMAALDVMDDGTLVGKNDKKEPGIYRDSEVGWESLPYPNGDWKEGSCTQCTGDGKYITGYIMGKGDATSPYKTFPALWEKQEDDNYKYVGLPNPQTDFLGGKTQFVSPRTISPDGKTIIGVMMEQRGFYSQPIVYHKKDNGEWEYETPFVALSYNMDVYKTWMDKEPQMKDYITAHPGESGYIEQVKTYQRAYAKWQFEFFKAWKKGPEFTSVPVIMSENGKFLAPTTVINEYSYTEGATDIELVSQLVYPCRYNTATKEVEIIKTVPDFVPVAVSNYGDMLSSDGEKIFLLLHENNEKIELSEWLNKKYGFNLYDKLPSNTEYLDCQTVGGSLDLIVASYRSVLENGDLDKKEVFCIKLPIVNNIMQTLNTPSSATIYIKDNMLMLTSSEKVEKVSIYDLAGGKVFESASNQDCYDISSLPKGVYIVAAKVNGQTVKAKVYKESGI
ncbi:T9SS type A sorting domain-containing protein [Prevotella falsenii]|uniref:T9SS type A sorting domain-containing protein n=1 Tax=Prevotella falsenii TaxID=515414 RepID=UPI000469A87D|nr:T9SS type A sorting domain-containing protein [Prevotella falsenii]